MQLHQLQINQLFLAQSNSGGVSDSNLQLCVFTCVRASCTHYLSHTGLSMSGVNHQHLNAAKFHSPAQIDPFYTQRYNNSTLPLCEGISCFSCRDDINVASNDLFQQCWVTVYG